MREPLSLAGAVLVAAEMLSRYRQGDAKAIAPDLVELGGRFAATCTEDELAQLFEELHPSSLKGVKIFHPLPLHPGRSVDVAGSDDSSEEHF